MDSLQKETEGSQAEKGGLFLKAIVKSDLKESQWYLLDTQHPDALASTEGRGTEQASKDASGCQIKDPARLREAGGCTARTEGLCANVI